jgi:hypothetical protein
MIVGYACVVEVMVGVHFSSYISDLMESHDCHPYKRPSKVKVEPSASSDSQSLKFQKLV